MTGRTACACCEVTLIHPELCQACPDCRVVLCGECVVGHSPAMCLEIQTLFATREVASATSQVVPALEEGSCVQETRHV